MKHTYHISGMTCAGCVNTVNQSLSSILGVTQVDVNLEKEEASFILEKEVSLEDLRKVLPKKYTISKIKTGVVKTLKTTHETSKLAQLKPLLLIFLYLFSAAFLLNYSDWNTGEAMLDFMGLFYIVFSFFKLLDLKGFPESFRMYDPLANLIPVYGWVYPFIELGLGLLFLLRFEIFIALTITILILGTTTFGVAKTLLDKKKIRCACLGTALKLPMTEATLIENSIMLIMAIAMLFNN